MNMPRLSFHLSPSHKDFNQSINQSVRKNTCQQSRGTFWFSNFCNNGSSFYLTSTFCFVGKVLDKGRARTWWVLLPGARAILVFSWRSSAKIDIS